VVIAHALLQLFLRCAPGVGPVTMSALVAYESDANPYAVGDNTDRRSYAPAGRAQAEELALRLLRAGHRIDVGYAQIDSDNFARLGIGPREAFDDCTNVGAGARILTEDYARAALRFGPGQAALMHALSAYNTGGFWAGLGYARGVYASAAALRFESDSR
jgi:type IV secretion system protein VirB1